MKVSNFYDFDHILEKKGGKLFKGGYYSREDINDVINQGNKVCLLKITTYSRGCSNRFSLKFWYQSFLVIMRHSCNNVNQSGLAFDSIFRGQPCLDLV